MRTRLCTKGHTHISTNVLFAPCVVRAEMVDRSTGIGMSSCKIITELLFIIIIYCIFSETLIRYEENKKDFMKFRQLGKK